MISRRVDSMGRVVIPQEMRDKLGISHDTLMDISLKGNKIELKKSELSCAVCGGSSHMLKGASVCRSCAEDIAAKLAAVNGEA